MRILSRLKPKIIHNPGKFIGSKNSNRYHNPKCEWADKISPKMRVWFDSKKAAAEKGYEPAVCCRK